MTKLTSIFPIVGVGASAGGLNSFKKFLGSITVDSGMAYVLLQHLDPSHESLLPEILSRFTEIPVQEITDNVELKQNHVYVLPENKVLTVVDHSLKLTPRNSEITNLPIDFFFDSLAKVHKTLAVGVILSGTAHDGTHGLKSIKEYGGITFAEDPQTASWEGMPQSAISAGVVDFILPSDAIIKKLLEINKVYKNTPFWEEEKLPKGQENDFRQILSLLHLKSDVDFNYYKQPTIKRRIARRMAINQIDNLKKYLGLLRENSMEQDALFQDILIQVTSFFRDSNTFKELGDKIFPAILKNRTGDRAAIRIWVAGCSTGEETYSMAITLYETLLAIGQLDRKIQIFASDISNNAIDKARQGIYSALEVKPIHKDRLFNYFTKINADSYKVNKNIRDLIVFAPHNFLKNPPFAKMDLISCRNVFIYMDSFLQKRLVKSKNTQNV